jgi:two-component system, NarL family, sensor histidine kinase DevS
LDAVAGVASDLSLADVLRRIVRSARDLVGADHATLGMVGPNGEPAEYIHDGCDDTAHRPIRLGVSTYARGVHVGDLRLTRTRGGGEFGEEDEAIVGALATAGGIAIDNARLFEQTRQRELWLRASHEITGALLAGQHPPTALALVTRRARAMAGARFAAIALPRNGAADTVWSGAVGPGAKNTVR